MYVTGTDQNSPEWKPFLIAAVGLAALNQIVSRMSPIWNDTFSTLPPQAVNNTPIVSPLINPLNAQDPTLLDALGNIGGALVNIGGTSYYLTEIIRAVSELFVKTVHNLQVLHADKMLAALAMAYGLHLMVKLGRSIANDISDQKKKGTGQNQEQQQQVVFNMVLQMPFPDHLLLNQINQNNPDKAPSQEIIVV